MSTPPEYWTPLAQLKPGRSSGRSPGCDRDEPASRAGLFHKSAIGFHGRRDQSPTAARTGSTPRRSHAGWLSRGRRCCGVTVTHESLLLVRARLRTAHRTRGGSPTSTPLSNPCHEPPEAEHLGVVLQGSRRMRFDVREATAPDMTGLTGVEVRHFGTTTVLKLRGDHEYNLRVHGR